MSTESDALKIVEAALGIDDPHARAALVDAECGDDAALRARVAALLAHEETSFRLMPTESFIRPMGIVESIPDRIGPYRVTAEIARGGMGAVVRAERADGVFAQTVAIKLIRADLASERAKARFAEERRILARLRHAGIVRILDGGEQDNRAWLAMDYVEGGPVTEMLERLGSSQACRLDAFEAVCEAVAYAHRALVVHADIKPSNVLLGEDGRVHLLDFGIARLMVGLDPDESGDPYPLTKGYAAPERGVGVAPTIASDVFSLGVLMLGMLGCRTPGEEGDFVPGTRLPVGQLDGDLAAIAGRALSEKPQARYPDVPALLSDIRRHRAFVPVEARSDAGWRYAAGRFIQRHRKGLALTTLAVLMLVGTSVISTVQYVRAELARAEADQRFAEVRQLAKFMLTELSDDLNDAPGTVVARARLAEVSGRYLERLGRVPDAPADVRLGVAQGYRRLASLQGLSGTSSLGRPQQAAKSLDRAGALLAILAREQPRNAAVLEEQGRVALARWVLASDTKGAQWNNAAAADFRAALAVEPGRTGAIIGLLTTEKNRGFDLTNADRPKEALPVLRAALSRLRGVKVSTELRREAQLLEVSILARIGDALYYAGDVQGALGPYRESAAIIKAELLRAPSLLWTEKLGEAAFNISGTLGNIDGRYAEALQEARAGSEAMRRTLAFGPDAAIEMRLLVLYGQEANILSAMGRNSEAADVSARGIAMREARLEAAPTDPTRLRDLAVALANHAEVVRLSGQNAAACDAARRGQRLLEEMRGNGNLAERDARIELPKMEAAAIAACPR